MNFILYGLDYLTSLPCDMSIVYSEKSVQMKCGSARTLVASYTFTKI